MQQTPDLHRNNPRLQLLVEHDRKITLGSWKILESDVTREEPEHMVGTITDDMPSSKFNNTFNHEAVSILSHVWKATESSH